MILVDPREIRGHFTRELSRHLLARFGRDHGVVADGKWDVDLVEFVDFTSKPAYVSCHERWVERRPWEETPLVQSYLDKLAAGIPTCFASVDELRERYASLDRIYFEVVQKQTLSWQPEHLVQISVTRDRTLLWGPNGRHRVAVALIAGLEAMPARVGVIHARALDDFQELRVSPGCRLARIP